MSTKLLERFRKGSYKGVEFDVYRISHKQVKKTKEHQFSNSSRRYVEERGVQEPDYEIGAYIFGDGDSYLDKRDKLRKVLAEEGSGLLVLPYEGEFYAKSIDFSDDHSVIDNIGRGDFSMKFSVTGKKEQNGNPVAVKDDKVALAEKTNKAKSIVAGITNSNLSISSALNYGGVLAKVTGVSSAMGSVLSQVADSAGMALSLSSFKSGLTSMMSGGAIGTGISDLFTVFETFSTDASSLFGSASSMFSFGDDDVEVSTITPARTEAVTNSQVLNTQVQVTATTVASNALANTDYSNTEDLSKDGTAVKEQIQKILASDTLNSSSISGVSDLSIALRELLVAVDDVIASKSVDTPNLITITAKNTSVSMIAYQYYDSLDDVDTLLSLNNMTKTSIKNQSIRILSDG